MDRTELRRTRTRAVLYYYPVFLAGATCGIGVEAVYSGWQGTWRHPLAFGITTALIGSLWYVVWVYRRVAESHTGERGR